MKIFYFLWPTLNDIFEFVWLIKITNNAYQAKIIKTGLILNSAKNYLSSIFPKGFNLINKFVESTSYLESDFIITCLNKSEILLYYVILLNIYNSFNFGKSKPNKQRCLKIILLDWFQKPIELIFGKGGIGFWFIRNKI